LIFSSLEFIEDEGFVLVVLQKKRERVAVWKKERERSESDLIKSGIGNILEFKWAH